MELIEPTAHDVAAPVSPPKANGRRPIVVYDSGVGGLTVASCISRHLPTHDLVYVADNGWFPYGDKPESDLQRRVLQVIDKVTKAVHPAAIMVACNTASTAIVHRLSRPSLVPLEGVLPPIREALLLSRTGRIALLATPGTLQRAAIRGVLAEFKGRGLIASHGSLELVRAAERKLAGHAVDPQQLARYFDETWLGAAERRLIDVVILGCTHFPHLKDELRVAFPGVHHWVDPAAMAAQSLAKRVHHSPLSRQAQIAPHHRLLLTSSHNGAELADIFAAAGFGGDYGKEEAA
ncbi:glutamate racemase [mine drainage metagenome]|uniref:glutamate racemase n=1 Tax=mine drainage metagenome TaxID=410659 RepID=A0A1J5RSB5_9ZZZZ